MKIKLNDITQLLYKIFSEKIIYFVGNDSEAIMKSNGCFDSFLFGLHSQESKIKNYILSCNDIRLPKKCFTYIKNIDNYRFLFVINPDKSSCFEINYIKKSRKEFDVNFIEDTLYKDIGYVYIIQSDYGYKIGCTGNLTQRISNFTKQFPFKVKVHSTIKCIGYNKIERTLHSVMNHKRINGEWFKLNNSDFIEMDKILKNMNLIRVPLFANSRLTKIKT